MFSFSKGNSSTLRLDYGRERTFLKCISTGKTLQGDVSERCYNSFAQGVARSPAALLLGSVA